jgi:hypothetical protein
VRRGIGKRCQIINDLQERENVPAGRHRASGLAPEPREVALPLALTAESAAIARGAVDLVAVGGVTLHAAKFARSARTTSMRSITKTSVTFDVTYRNAAKLNRVVSLVPAPGINVLSQSRSNERVTLPCSRIRRAPVEGKPSSRDLPRE